MQAKHLRIFSFSAEELTLAFNMLGCPDQGEDILHNIYSNLSEE